jgi:SAM-dependent methyltransferase
MPRFSVKAVKAYYHKILPFYEAQTEDRNDLEFWRTLVAEQRPTFVLELGAGTGRVTEAMKESARVLAMDLSLEMLERASARLCGRSIDECFTVEFVVADMRHFAFARRFDLIVASNDPFAHVTRLRERQTILRNIRNHLAPGGRLVLEGLYRPERKRSETPERSMNGISVREVWEPFGKLDCWRAHYYYRRGDQYVNAEFTARAWNTAEIKRLFEGCGLNLREIWGDFDRRPVTLDSKRIIVIAESLSTCR